MAITIVTRASKGAALNAVEHDTNLTNIVTAIEDSSVGHDHDGADSKKVSANNVINTPSGDISATNIQDAVNELAGDKLLERAHETSSVTEIIWYNASGNPVTTAGSQTLSNKTLTSPIISDLMQATRDAMEIIDYTP